MVYAPLVLALTTVALVTSAQIDPRVYNGQEIGSNEFKFLVELKINNTKLAAFQISQCSASILNSQWIITAAHCVSLPGQINQIMVSRLRSSVKPLSIRNYIRHPNFVPSADGKTVPNESINSDLALLQTSQPIQFDQNVQPVNLGEFYQSGQLGSIAGYGQPVYEPRKGDVMLERCYVSNLQVLCSKGSSYMPRNGHGDSGGPVVTNGVLVGVISSWIQMQPGVYTNYFAGIPSNYDWIQSVINQ